MPAREQGSGFVVDADNQVIVGKQARVDVRLGEPDRALARLREAVEGGYADADRLAEDEVLASALPAAELEAVVERARASGYRDPGEGA